MVESRGHRGSDAPKELVDLRRNLASTSPVEVERKPARPIRHCAALNSQPLTLNSILSTADTSLLPKFVPEEGEHR